MFQKLNTVYVSVTLNPTGQVTAVDLHDERPALEEVARKGILCTVWCAPIPPAESGESCEASELLNLAVSGEYRTDAPDEWTADESACDRFRADPSGEWIALRSVEAHLILAGVGNAHTTLVATARYGLTITDQRYDDLYVYRTAEGWKAAIECGHDYEGWSEISTCLAPPDAEPADVATAIRQLMTQCGIPAWPAQT